MEKARFQVVIADALNEGFYGVVSRVAAKFNVAPSFDVDPSASIFDAADDVAAQMVEHIDLSEGKNVESGQIQDRCPHCGKELTQSLSSGRA